MLYLRLLVILLLFAAVIMLAVPRRIFEMQNANLHNLDASLQHEELKSLKALKDYGSTPNSAEYLQAVENLAWVYWQEAKLPEAEKWFKVLCQARRANLKHEYDPSYVKAELCLAGVYRDTQKYFQAEAIYKEIQAYEQKFFKPPNLYLARDCANLGLIYYLQAQTTDDVKVKKTELDLARAMCDTALDQDKMLPGTARLQGIVLSTEYLVLRDLGLQKESDAAKARADSILAAARNGTIEP